MRYIADTIIKYITNECEPEKSTLRFILPSMPSQLLLYLGKRLNEHFNRIHKRRVRFLYGVAYRLGRQWENQTDIDRANFHEICNLGWYNDSNNLTSLRNEIKGNDEDSLVILLAGYEHIDDRASLQDFFHLDQQVLWDFCLGRSFEQWVHDCLRPYLNSDDSIEDFRKIDELLKALYDNGLADLLSISSYLETTDFSGVMNGNDAYRHILNKLACFKLPRMIGLSGKYVKKSAYQYFSLGIDFFNYSIFLDEGKRKSHIQKIVKFQNHNTSLQLDEDTLGDFEDLASLLQGLKEYISHRSERAASVLRTADFVFIYDQVFGFKAKNGHPRDPKPKKLQGLPLEVFLRSIWLALGEFKKNAKSRSMLMIEELPKITITSLRFKHDFNTGEDCEITDVRETAKTFLCQIIGGIDAFLEDHIRISLGDILNPVVVSLKSNLGPSSNNDLIYEQTSTAEPSFIFEVNISSERHESVRKEFVWGLPHNHQCRLLVDLFKWVSDEFKQGSNALPCFAMRYLPELFMSSDEEEATRVLITSLQKHNECFMIDLLKAPGTDDKDELVNLLIKLSIAYQGFLTVFNKSGFFVALNESYERLRKAFSDAYMRYLEKSDMSTLGPLLFKAFMIVSENKPIQPGWSWQDHLKGAVVTPLHPSELEMIRHQHTFLCDSFCFYVKIALEESGEKMFSQKRWDKVVDLAKIHRPIYGLLKDANLALDTNVHSYSYIHLVGECGEACSFINSRLVLEQDDSEEEEITDIELFRETRSSRLLKQVLVDYRDLYAFADDGISIGAYCGGDIQAVIAGINDFLIKIINGRSEREYTLNLTVFSDSGDDSAIMRWIDAWKDRWQEADLSTGKKHYQNCRISIAYRVLSASLRFEHLNSLLKNIDLDVIIFTDFIGAMASRFELLEEGPISIDDYRKFPILEKACCKVVGGGGEQQRERILSNPRFRLGGLHAEVMARIKNSGQTKFSQKHTVINKSDFGPWVEVIDTAHEHCAWVVCIDPAVDEQLLKKTGINGTTAREIIGIGTGVGSHGENNFTISTEQFAMSDIKKKISYQIASLLGPVGQVECEHIADNLVSAAAQITGLSVVKATGPIRFVRELVANAMVRKLLPRDREAFCDEIISLDAFTHWFDDAIDEERPDLLRLHATIVNGFFHIEAQIIECKLAQEAQGYLEKARQQIENGLRRLVDCFRPRGERPVGIDDKPPDQRYWWMQLHRLIASKGEVSRPKYKATLLALESLSEGYFNINWQASVVAFWTDLENDTLQHNPEWNFTWDGQDMTISVVTAGKYFIKKACLQKADAIIFGNATKLSFTYQKRVSEAVGDNDYDALSFGSSELGTLLVSEDSFKATELKPSNNILDMVEGKRTNIEVTKTIPDRILLGNATTGGREVYWEFGHHDLPNRHILVFGASGTGKTYTIQALLCELSKAGQNSLIVDYSNGFTTKQLETTIIERLKPTQHLIRREPLGINPFRQQCDFIDDTPLLEDPAITAQRVSGVFAEVYQLGDQQKSALYSAIRSGIMNEGINFGLRKLVQRIEDIQLAGGPTAGSANSLISKIQPFVDMHPFGQEAQESWDKLFSDNNSRCHVIQLAGFMKDTARLITEFSLIDLYWYYRARGSKDDPKVIVLDEIQNLDHKLDSPLGQFLTEGRKFGISLILATQTLSNLGKDEKDRLFQAGHKLFFKPADTEIRSFAQILADATGTRMDEWVDRLSSLNRGECYSLGYAFNEPAGKLEVSKWFKIRIKSLGERV